MQENNPYTISSYLFLATMDALKAFVEIESIKGKNAIQRKEAVLKALITKHDTKPALDTFKAMLRAGICKQYPTNLSKLTKVATDGGIFNNDKMTKIKELIHHYETTPFEPIEDPLVDVNDAFLRRIEPLFAAKSANGSLRLGVCEFIGLFPEDLRPMLEKVFTKGLNIGIAAKSINSVFNEEVIADLELMKCKKERPIVEEWLKDGKDVYAELKYDGIRGFATIPNKKVQSMKTYNMTPFHLDKLTTIIPQLENLAKLSDIDNFFFDFEITDGLRQSISGKVNSHLQGKSIEGCDKEWLINIFDLVDLGVFACEETLTYDERRSLLESAINNCHKKLRPNIRLSQRWKITSMEQLDQLFEQVLQDGHEGLVVKCGDGKYELKKSSLWVKLKAEKEADLVIVNYYYGKKGTKREHLIGGFECESSDGFISVGVGSGFTDKILKEIDENTPQSYIGKIVEVKFNSTISDENHNNSLFLPRFKRFRFDKDTANSFSEILAK